MYFLISLLDPFVFLMKTRKFKIDWRMKLINLQTTYLFVYETQNSSQESQQQQ